jgi:hypothetical protein
MPINHDSFILVGVMAFEGDDNPAHGAKGLNAAFAHSEN